MHMDNCARARVCVCIIIANVCNVHWRTCHLESLESINSRLERFLSFQ